MAKNTKTISQRIAFEGGEAIEKQLKALGEAGEKAFNQIRAAAARADFAKFGASLKAFGADLATVARRTALAGSALAAGAGSAAVAMSALAKESAEVVDSAGKSAQAAGVQVDAYTRLAYAAELADLEQSDFDAGLARLNKTIGDAARGSKSAVDLFARLGVTFKDSEGKIRPTEDIIFDLADAFSRLPDGAEKSALAIEMLGRSGAKWLPLLNAGKQGFIDLGKEAKRLGVEITPAMVEAGEEMNDTLTSLAKAMGGVRLQLGILFTPFVTEAAAAFRDAIAANRQAIVAFGRAVLVGGIHAVRDLVNMLAGRDDKVRNPWILKWRDALLQFGKDAVVVISGVASLFKMIHAGAKLVADGFNKVFGTDLTAGTLLLGAAVLRLLGVFKLLGSTFSVVVSGAKLLGRAFLLLGGKTAASWLWTLITDARIFIGLIGTLVGWPALLVGALVAAGVAVYTFWDEIKSGGQVAWDFIKGLFSSEAVTALFAGLWNAGAQVVATLQGMFSGLWDSIKGVAAPLWDEIAGAWNEALASAQEVFDSFITFLSETWESVSGSIAQTAQGMWDGIVGAVEAAKNRVIGIWDGAISTIKNTINEAISFINRLVDRISAAISRAKELVGLGGSSDSSSAQGFASGGHLAHGRGTSTSDSIPAMLSVGEFVTRAKAVAYYGPDFFHMLNSMKISKSRLFDALQGMRGFSIGGFADSIGRSLQVGIPHLASGGFANMQLAPAVAGGGLTGTPVTLVMPSGERVETGAPVQAAAKLSTYATGNAGLSAGRKPGWYK